MTREEAIARVKHQRDWANEVNRMLDVEAFDMAIKALEQEPTTKNDLGVDAISRQAVIDELKRYFHDEYYQRTSIQDCRDCFIEDVLNHLPSVTPQEPKKGHWEETTYSHHYYNDQEIETEDLRCSCCKEYTEWDISLPHKPYYCENCGADMRENEE